MINIAQWEEIQNVLLEIPGMIQYLERGELDLLLRENEWLAKAERILIRNRMAAAATLAALRGMLINAEHGVLPEQLQLKKRSSIRKAKEAVAMDVLRQAEEVLTGILKGPAAQFAEGERVARQLVVVAWRKGLTKTTQNLEHTAYLQWLWQALMNDPDLQAGTMHLQGLVEYCNALVLLDRALVGLEGIENHGSRELCKSENNNSR